MSDDAVFMRDLENQIVRSIERTIQDEKARRIRAIGSSGDLTLLIDQAFDDWRERLLKREHECEKKGEDRVAEAINEIRTVWLDGYRAALRTRRG